jgi:DegV family protein with EDD domain
MPIKIVTDSTSDVPPAAAAEYDINVVPCYINIENKSYLDGLELSRHEFYENLPTYPSLPKTSSPNSRAFETAYQRAIADGASHIISIHVSSAWSSVVDTARLAAQTIRSVPVTVVDSGSVTLGLGFLAMAAARAAAAGISANEIISLLKERARRTILFAGLDTADYLRRSGRASRLQASLSAFLHIFPVLRVYQGAVDMEKIRTHARVAERLVELAQEWAPLEELAVMHTNCLEKAEEIRNRIRHLLPDGKIWIGEATPAIGTHVGPNGIGLVCVQAKQA